MRNCRLFWRIRARQLRNCRRLWCTSGLKTLHGILGIFVFLLVNFLHAWSPTTVIKDLKRFGKLMTTLDQPMHTSQKEVTQQTQQCLNPVSERRAAARKTRERGSNGWRTAIPRSVHGHCAQFRERRLCESSAVEEQLCFVSEVGLPCRAGDMCLICLPCLLSCCWTYVKHLWRIGYAEFGSSVPCLEISSVRVELRWQCTVPRHILRLFEWFENGDQAIGRWSKSPANPANKSSV